VAPFPEFFRQGALFGLEAAGLQILQPLMHQIEGVVDQLGCLIGGHRHWPDGLFVGTGPKAVLYRGQLQPHSKIHERLGKLDRWGMIRALYHIKLPAISASKLCASLQSKAQASLHLNTQ
jgi:hypothetical protein